MKLSFIICTFNRSKILKECIDSILKDIKQVNKKEFEILIIDNNSSDDTNFVSSELIKKNKNITYYLEERIGLSNARNRGILEAKGDILIFLDDDTIVNEGYCNAVISLFKNKDIICAGGRIIPVWNCEKPKWFQDSFASIIGETNYGEKTRVMKKNEDLLGGNMIFRKEVFEKIGLFNCELGLKGEKLCLGEENDICEKIRNSGELIFYIADAKVGHKVHKEKVNKEYIENRLILEGRMIAKSEKLGKKINSRIKTLIFRLGILCIRDIPNYLFYLNDEVRGFEKKCKMKRSIAYIKEWFEK